MIPPEGLAIGLMILAALKARLLTRWSKPKKDNILDWSKQTPEYLEALSALDKEFPTGDSSELSLKQFLEAKELKTKSWNSINGSWNTLYAPGLANALKGASSGALFPGKIFNLDDDQQLGQYHQQQQALMQQARNEALQNWTSQQSGLQNTQLGLGCPAPQQQQSQQDLIAQLLGQPRKKS